MGRIFIKTVNGRKYRYERLETKRVGKKVVTKDRYLGAERPVQNAFETLSTTQKKTIGGMWKDGHATKTIVTDIRIFTGRKYAESTTEKWCREQFGKRGKK